jgi:hypothetical protein
MTNGGDQYQNSAQLLINIEEFEDTKAVIRIVNRTRTNIAMAKEKKGETTIYSDLQNITYKTKD